MVIFYSYVSLPEGMAQFFFKYMGPQIDLEKNFLVTKYSFHQLRLKIEAPFFLTDWSDWNVSVE